MHNLVILAQTFERTGAARVERTTADSTRVFLFQDEKSMKGMGLRAKPAFASLRPATGKTIESMESSMG